MARFRGTVEATLHRMTTDCNGRDLGVNVDGGVSATGDHFTVYITGGSNESCHSHKIATVEEIAGSFSGSLRSRRITLFDRDGNQIAEYTL